jgi:hypothetical protein
MGFFDDMLSTPVSIVAPLTGGMLGRKNRKEQERQEDLRNFQDAQNTAINKFFEENFPRLDTPGVTKLRQDALRAGPSPFARLQEQLQFAEEAEAREGLLSGAKARGAESVANLAAGGGLTSGARERIEEGSIESANLAGQGLGRQGLFNRLRARLSDEEAKREATRALSEFEVANEMSKFQTKAGLFGGHQQAESMLNFGQQPGLFGGTGFLGLF